MEANLPKVLHYLSQIAPTQDRRYEDCRSLLLPANQHIICPLAVLAVLIALCRIRAVRVGWPRHREVSVAMLRLTEGSEENGVQSCCQ